MATAGVDGRQDDDGREQGTVAWPLIDFPYEVSFYLVGRECCSALHAPDRARRGELQSYDASAGAQFPSDLLAA